MLRRELLSLCALAIPFLVTSSALALDVKATASGLAKKLKEGKVAEFYAGFRDLLQNPEFSGESLAIQRGALRILILAKGVDSELGTPVAIEAHRAAIEPLKGVMAKETINEDFLLLGMANIVIGDINTASAVLREGLARERAVNPKSLLCELFLKQIARL